MATKVDDLSKATRTMHALTAELKKEYAANNARKLDLGREMREISERPFPKSDFAKIVCGLGGAIDKGGEPYQKLFNRIVQGTQLYYPLDLVARLQVFPLSLSRNDSSLWSLGHTARDEPIDAAAIAFFFGDQLKAGMERLIAEAPWPTEVGLPLEERRARLAAIAEEIRILEERSGQIYEALRSASALA